MSGAAIPLRLPALRQELRIERGAPLVNGAPAWTLFDPVRHMFFQLGELEFSILSRWAAGQLDKIGGDLRAKGYPPDDADRAFGQVLDFCLANNLTETPMGDAVATFQQQRVAAKKAWWKWLVDNYLFFRIPLVRPAAFLERTLPHVAFLWSRHSLVFFALLALAGLFLVSRQWDGFLSSFDYFFSWQGLIAYGAGLFVVKIMHELGHAYTATRFGCRVPTMGVSLMLMVPMLYTDTTGAWRLRSRRERLMIDCAGVTAELMVASVSTLLWVMLPDGIIRSIFFVLATSSWILSLGINLNPFMRFDGYYVLSDWMGIPNLQPRAFALGRWRLREALFGLRAAPPEDVPQGLRRFMILYAWITWIYRLVLFIGIALLVYHMFFKLLGIVLFVVEIGVFVVKPVLSELQIWVGKKDDILRGVRGRRWPLIVAGAALILFLPLDRHVSAPALLTPVGASPIVAGDPARIERVFVRDGQRVEAGMPLMELIAPEMQAKAAETRLRIAKYQEQLNRTVADDEDLADRLVLERELAREVDTLAGLDRRKQRLILRAPHAGVVRGVDSRHHPGRHLGGAEILAYIITPRDFDVVAYVGEADLIRLKEGNLGRFVANDATRASWALKVVELSSTANDKLDQPILASTNGGMIPVDEDDTGVLRPRTALYPVRLVAEKKSAPGLVQPAIGEVSISSDSRSMAGRVLGDIIKVVVAELSLT